MARANGHNGRAVASQFQVEEVSQMADLIAAMRSRNPAVLLLSMEFPSLGGPAGIRELRRLSPSTKVIVLSRSANDQEELEVLRAGGHGYCGPVDSEVLLKMIDKVQQGEIWAGRRTIGALLDDFYESEAEKPPYDSFDRLTSREREILYLLAAGASNKEIAMELEVTVATVKAHLTKMFRKLGQPDRLHLALYAAAQRRAYQ